MAIDFGLGQLVTFGAIFIGAGLLLWVVSFAARHLAGVDLAVTLTNLLNAAINGVGRIFSFAPSPIKWMLFAVVGVSLLGFIMQWVLAANVMCVGCQTYEADSFVSASALKMYRPDQSYTCNGAKRVTDPGKPIVNYYYVSDKGDWGITEKGLFNFGTWLSEDGATSPSVGISGRQVLAVPTEFDERKLSNKDGDIFTFTVCKKTSNSTKLFGLGTNDRPDLPVGVCYYKYGTCSYFTNGAPIKTVNVKTLWMEQEEGQSAVPLVQMEYKGYAESATGIASGEELENQCSQNVGGTYKMTPGSYYIEIPAGMWLNAVTSEEVQVSDNTSGYVSVKYVYTDEVFGETLSGQVSGKREAVLQDAADEGVVKIHATDGLSMVSYTCTGNDRVKVLVGGVDIFRPEVMLLLMALFFLIWAVTR